MTTTKDEKVEEAPDRPTHTNQKKGFLSGKFEAGEPMMMDPTNQEMKGLLPRSHEEKATQGDPSNQSNHQPIVQCRVSLQPILRLRPVLSCPLSIIDNNIACKTIAPFPTRQTISVIITLPSLLLAHDVRTSIVEFPIIHDTTRDHTHIGGIL